MAASDLNNFLTLLLSYFCRASKRKSYYYGIAFGMSQSIIFFAYAALYRFGAFLVAEGKMNPEDVYK